MNEFLSGDLAPLVTGVVLAICALAAVLQPVLDGTNLAPRPSRPEPSVLQAAPRLEVDDEPLPGSAVEALREIEFDKATGKLSDSDYASLMERYTRAAEAEATPHAVAVATAPAGGGAVDDLAEARIRKYRGYADCGTCGPRPEPDALYCSTCGTYLPGVCEQCGEAITVAGSRYCVRCGHVLAA